MRLSPGARLSAALLAVVLLASHLLAQAAPDADFEQLLDRASRYSLRFVSQLSQVVSEEHYVQDSSVAVLTAPTPGLTARGGSISVPSSRQLSTARHRELKADFLIVRTNSELLTPFRDVFEVDHVPVRSREERLTRLFLKNRSAGTEEQARAIAEESARYNLGGVERTINNPIFALVLLQPDLRPRFTFTPGKPDRSAGDGIRVVDYTERVRPTVITGPGGQDMPAFGRFWIDGATGRIVKTELRVEVKDFKANLTTKFRRDERVGIDVPEEFREDYDMPTMHVAGVADYSRFRRFAVKSTEEFVPPAPETPEKP